jgi:hypothetical protein
MSQALSSLNCHDGHLQLSTETKRTIGKWFLGTSSFTVTVLSGIAIGAALLSSPLGWSVLAGVGAVAVGALAIGAIGITLILLNSDHPASDMLGSFSIGFLAGSLVTGALAVGAIALVISALGHMRF